MERISDPGTYRNCRTDVFSHANWTESHKPACLSVRGKTHLLGGWGWRWEIKWQSAVCQSSGVPAVSHQPPFIVFVCGNPHHNMHLIKAAWLKLCAVLHMWKSQILTLESQNCSAQIHVKVNQLQFCCMNCNTHCWFSPDPSLLLVSLSKCLSYSSLYTVYCIFWNSSGPKPMIIGKVFSFLQLPKKL